MYKYIFLSILIIFTGCAPKQQDFVEKKIYKGYSKDAILEASKKVFQLADTEKKFQIDSYRNKVEVTKNKFYHHGLDVGVYLDTWTLETLQEDKQTRVILNLKRVDVLEEDKEIPIEKSLNTRIFWDRLEYLLGMNKTWQSCYKNVGFFSNDALLCDMGVLVNKIPNKNDLVKNPLIKQRPKKVYSVETIDADIYKFKDLSIVKNKDDIFEQDKETITSDILDPVVDDNILIDDKINGTKESKSDSKSDDEAQKDLDKLKQEMDQILGQKQELKIDNIVEEEEIQENSEFFLEEKQIESSEEKLNKLDTIK